MLEHIQEWTLWKKAVFNLKFVRDNYLKASVGVVETADAQAK